MGTYAFTLVPCPSRSCHLHRGVRTVETLPDLPVRHRRWLAGDAGCEGLLLSQTLVEFSAHDPDDFFFGHRVGGVGLVLLGWSGGRRGPQRGGKWRLSQGSWQRSGSGQAQYLFCMLAPW